jgi:hypothetical protein
VAKDSGHKKRVTKCPGCAILEVVIPKIEEKWNESIASLLNMQPVFFFLVPANKN